MYGKLQITAGFARRMELTAGDRGFALKQRTKKAPSRPPPPGPASQFVPRISLLSSSAAARGGFRLSGPDGLCGSGGVRVLGTLWGGAVCVCVCVFACVCVFCCAARLGFLVLLPFALLLPLGDPPQPTLPRTDISPGTEAAARPARCLFVYCARALAYPVAGLGNEAISYLRI